MFIFLVFLFFFFVLLFLFPLQILVAAVKTIALFGIVILVSLAAAAILATSKD
jgi:hypothetical protein